MSSLLSWERRILAHHQQGFPGALVAERPVALPPVWLAERSMPEADEYRQFANDCIVWARIATSDDQRARLVELAKHGRPARRSWNAPKPSSNGGLAK